MQPNGSEAGWRRRHAGHAATVMLLWALPALALTAGTATVESATENGTIRMDVRWLGRDMRLEFPNEHNAYMLMRNGRAYSVSSRNGRTMVLDLSALGKMGQSMGADDGAPDMGPNSLESLERIESTGASETVAGVEGEVYIVAWTDGTGASHQATAVLSDDPLVRELTDAFRQSSRTMGAEADPLGDALVERDAGVLRFAHMFRVVRVSAEAPPADDFELPAEPLRLQDLMRHTR